MVYATRNKRVEEPYIPRFVVRIHGQNAAKVIDLNTGLSAGSTYINLVCNVVLFFVFVFTLRRTQLKQEKGSQLHILLLGNVAKGVTSFCFCCFTLKYFNVSLNRNCAAQLIIVKNMQLFILKCYSFFIYRWIFALACAIYLYNTARKNTQSI